MSKPKAWVCWSCGKDSAWALHVVRQQNEVDVVGLLTVITETYGRTAMHAVREDVLVAQAKALGLPVCRVPIPSPCSNEVYRQAMRRAVDQARDAGVRHMIFGDLYLQDVRSYREESLQGTGIAPLFPLWMRPTRALAGEMIDGGLVAYVTSLDPRKMPREFAGSVFNAEFLRRLPAGVDPCAENGEFHTCVTAGPMFVHPLNVTVGQTLERECFVFTDLVLVKE